MQRLGLLILFISFFFSQGLKGQELKAKVAVNVEKLGAVDKQQFAELERKLTDLLNTTRWTNTIFSSNERIICNFAINISSVEDDRKYQAELFVTAQRPVYNTSYNSPLLVYRDKELNFEYQAFDVLEFNPNQITNNLVATVAFYAYFILALDFDSFAPTGGTFIINQMRQLVNSSSQANPEWKGWTAYDNDYNRYAIAEALNDKTQENFRLFWYQYHRKGLDEMLANTERAQKSMLESIQNLEELQKIKANSPLLMVVSQTKLNEIIQIASELTLDEKKALYKKLFKLYPTEGNTLDVLKQ